MVGFSVLVHACGISRTTAGAILRLGRSEAELLVLELGIQRSTAVLVTALYLANISPTLHSRIPKLNHNVSVSLSYETYMNGAFQSLVHVLKVSCIQSEDNSCQSSVVGPPQTSPNVGSDIMFVTGYAVSLKQTRSNCLLV